MKLSLLMSLGLTRNESEVYLASLQKMKVKTVSQLASAIGMDKSSAYIASKSLIAQGLLIPATMKRGTTVTAAHPDTLKVLIQRKEIEISKQKDLLGTVIDQLINESNRGTARNVTISKGFEALTSAVSSSNDCKEKLVREIWKQNNPIVSGPRYKKFIQEHAAKRISKGIFLKSLSHQIGIDTYKDLKVNKHSLMQSSPKVLKDLRITPYEFKNPNMLITYDDIVYIFTYDQDLEIYIIRIQDQLIAGFIKDMYDFIFERSIKYYATSVLPQKKLFDGTEIPALGIGTWGLGGYMDRNPYNHDINDVEQIKHSMSLGLSYIDTSLTYTKGYSIELLKQGLGYFPRGKLFINAKLTYSVKHKNDIEKQLNEYLEKFKTDYIDSFMIHAPAALDIPLEETIIEMNKLVKKGKIRYVSVSNFNVDQLKRARVSSEVPLALHEIHYNLVVRVNEGNGVINYCNKNNILMVAYQPLRRGFIASLEDKTLHELAQKYNVTQSQIAINWLTHQKLIMTVVKATNGSHINENAASFEFKMSLADYKMLDDWRMPGYVTPEYDVSGIGKDTVKIQSI